MAVLMDLRSVSYISSTGIGSLIKAYRSVLKKFPSTQPAAKLHSVLLASGRIPDADTVAASWMADHPKDIDFLTYLGEMSLAQGNLITAEARFKEVLALRPEALGALNNVAWIMVKLKKHGALEYAERANKAQPNTPALMDTLATVLAAENQIDKALEVQKKAVAIVPESPLLRLNLAKLQIQAGDKKAARSELEALTKLGDKFDAQAEVGRLLGAL